MQSISEYLRAGVQKYQSKDYQGALDIWRQGLSVNHDAQFYQNIGAALRKLRRVEEASLLYREAIASFPQLTPLRMNYINFLTEQADWGRALGAFDGWPGWSELPRFTGTATRPNLLPGITALQPSAEYTDLLRQYALMHRDVDDGQTGRKVFDGIFGLSRHAPFVGRLFRELAVRDALDYGGGKGRQYSDIPVVTPDGREFPDLKTYLSVENVLSWDPGVSVGNAIAPDDQFDAVLCMDVLEHCPASDLPWIVEGLFRRARRCVYMSIGNYPAGKKLPDGRNVHITIQPVAWWAGVIAHAAQAYPTIRYEAYVAPNANSQGVLIHG